MNRRELLVNAIGGAIMAGLTPPFLLRAFPPNEYKIVVTDKASGRELYGHNVTLHIGDQEIKGFASDNVVTFNSPHAIRTWTPKEKIVI